MEIRLELKDFFIEGMPVYYREAAPIEDSDLGKEERVSKVEELVLEFLEAVKDFLLNSTREDLIASYNNAVAKKLEEEKNV